MAQTGFDDGESTAVTIFGRTYNLRGGGDPEYLGRLATLVDVKMKEIATATGTADTLKVAILTALNLADEHLQGRPGSSLTDEDQSRVDGMIARLEEVLAECAPDPEDRSP